MKKNLPKRLKEYKKGNVTVVICKTKYFYDVIIEGDLNTIKELQSKCNWEHSIIEKSVFGLSLIVVDTCDDKKSANHMFRHILEVLP